MNFLLLLQMLSSAAAASSAGGIPSILNMPYYQHPRQKAVDHVSTYGYTTSPYRPTSSSPYSTSSAFDAGGCEQLNVLGTVAGGTALATLALFLLVDTQTNKQKKHSPPVPSYGTKPDVPSQETKPEVPYNGPSPVVIAHEMQVARGWGLEDFNSMTSPGEWSASVFNITCQLNDLMYPDKTTSGKSQSRKLSGNSCISGLIGCVTGFMALGILIAYALSMAAANNKQQRSFSGFHDLAVDGRGTFLVVQWLQLYLQRNDDCAPYTICNIVQHAEGFGEPYKTIAIIASLPSAWLLDGSELPGGRLLSDICTRGLGETRDNTDRCQELRHSCLKQ